MPSGIPTSDGQFRIYGDGSAGARDISASTVLTVDNLQFTDLTVEAGVALTVRSGTIIRCTGTFTNYGIITVSPATIGATLDAGGSNTTQQTAIELPDAGVALLAPGTGEFGSNAGLRRSGQGGIGLDSGQAATLLLPGVKAGGAGAGSLNGYGGDGGGSIVVLARTAIVNASGGIMSANAGDAIGFGAGGGAGGIIILASPGSVTNEGILACNASSGRISGGANGAGGGGGGGIIHVISPTIAGSGTRTVAKGFAGATGNAGSVTFTPREGGAGGGACGGSGGSGGNVTTANDPMPAKDGAAGQLDNEIADPTSLF